MSDLVSLPATDLMGPEAYISQSLSYNTLKAYRADLDHFLDWGGTIPCTADAIATYLSVHARSLAISTLQRRLASIRRAHQIGAYPDPTSCEIVRLTFRGIRRVHGKPQVQAKPLLRDDLIRVLAHIPDNVRGDRDKAMLLIGFCAALRRSELVALRVEDLEFDPRGLIIKINRSKTDQGAMGEKIAIPFGRSAICPVKSLNVWLLRLGAHQGMIFRQVGKGGKIQEGGLSDRAVNSVIKERVRLSGLDPTGYSGHSPRAGLATSAAAHGVSSWKIRQQTRHKSDAMLARYIRDGDIFTDNAAALF